MISSIGHIKLHIRISIGIALIILSLLPLYAGSYRQNEWGEDYYYEEIDSFALKPRFGLFADYQFLFVSASFAKLPGVPNCCKEFSPAGSGGFVFGGLFHYFFTEKLFAGARLGYSINKMDFESFETTNVIVDGVSTLGEFRHSLESDIGRLVLEPSVGYDLWNSFSVQAGASIGLNIYSNYYQFEEITKPENRGTFIDGTRTRNKSEGSVPELTTLQLSLFGGFSFDLKLNKKGSWLLSPEAFFHYGLSEQVNGLNWKFSSLRIGASVKYKEPPPPPPPPPPAPDPFDPEYPEPPSPPVLSPSITLVMVDSTNTEKRNFKVRIEDFISINMRPLLSYVFFDENSSKIPPRYRLISKSEADAFSYKELQNMDAMQTYYQVLNIIGKRLKDNPDKSIVIVGTNCNMDEERNNKQLSLDRANAVRDYLKNVWDVADNQMEIEARNLPKEASNNDEPGGREENRRVEIIARENLITEPVITTDTLRKFSSYLLKFYPKVVSDVGIDSWSLIVKQGSRELIKWNGKGTPPDKIDWHVTQEDSSAPKRGGLISYILSCKDKLGQIASSQISTIPVDQLSIDRKRLERIADKEFEYYSLILFDYGKSDLGAEHKSVLDFVKNRITEKSSVLITGHSDSMGDEKINRRLSESRARAAAKRIGLSDAAVSGIGESDLLYDNTLPEGRFYCRTVKIIIETPVEENQGE